jgi:hypothetical protein
MLAGLAFIADILFVLTAPEAEWTNVAYIVAALLLVVGMVGLHALQKGNYGRIGRGGFWTVVVASLAQVVGLIVFLLGSEALIWLCSRWASWPCLSDSYCTVLLPCKRGCYRAGAD